MGMLYLSTLFIIAGIEKEKHIVSSSVLLFGLIVEIIYIIYLYVLNISIYKYVIYLFLILLLGLVNKKMLRKKEKSNYRFEILMLCFYIAIFTTEKVAIATIIATLLSISINQAIILLKSNKNEIVKKDNYKKMPIGFYLCVTNIVIMIVNNYFLV